MEDVIETSNISYMFCSAKVRPDCFHNNLCCLHCQDVNVCRLGNTKSTKPCTTKICSLTERCEFQI